MKKIKRVILHIGTMKTGTSSIQSTLGNNHEFLKKHNIYYPKLKPFNHIFEFSPLFYDNPADSAEFKKKSIVDTVSVEQRCAELKQKWVNEIHECRCDNFIFSAEEFSVPVFNYSAIIRLENFLKQFFDEIYIIIYFRHFDSWIPSEIQQTIRNGQNPLGFGKLLKNLMEHESSRLMYTNCLKRWIEHFGIDKVTVRPFDVKAFKNGRLVDDFLNAAGFDPDKIRLDEIRDNEAIGKYAVTFLEKFNLKYPVLKKGKVNSDRGLSTRSLPIPFYISRKDVKFAPVIRYTKEWAERLNSEIDYANSLFENGYKFEYVHSSDEPSVFPTPDEIPLSWYIELVNNYNKRLEALLDRKEKLESEKVSTLKTSDSKYLETILRLYKANAQSIVLIVKNLFRWCRFKITGLKGFDEDYYVSTYVYVKDRAKDALLHFLVRGVYLGYNPNAEFDTGKYVLEHPEIVTSGENALLHFNKNKNV